MLHSDVDAPVPRPQKRRKNVWALRISSLKGSFRRCSKGCLKTQFNGPGPGSGIRLCGVGCYYFGPVLGYSVL